MTGKARSRYVTRPVNAVTVLPIVLGGTGATTAAGAVQNLGAVSNANINVPGGVLRLTPQGIIDPARIPSGIAGGAPSLESRAIFVRGLETTLDITDYDSFFNGYGIQVTGGSYYREDSRIAIKPNEDATTIVITIDKVPFSYPVVAQGIGKPKIIGHTRAAVSNLIYAESSPFVANGVNETHYATSWEFSRSRTFAKEVVVLRSYDDQVNLLRFFTAFGGTEDMFVRVRHIGSGGSSSDWSDPVQVQTESSNFTMTPGVLPLNETQILSLPGKALGQGHISLAGMGHLLLTSTAAYDGVSDTELVLYGRSKTNWGVLTTLKASQFGYAPNSGWGEWFEVHPEGKLIAISAPYADNGKGCVQILKWDGTTLTEVQVLRSPLLVGGGFGWMAKWHRGFLTVMENKANYIANTSVEIVQKKGALIVYSTSDGIVNPNPVSVVYPEAFYEPYREMATFGYMPYAQYGFQDTEGLNTSGPRGGSAFYSVTPTQQYRMTDDGSGLVQTDSVAWCSVRASGSDDYNVSDYHRDRHVAIAYVFSNSDFAKRISAEPKKDMSGGRIVIYNFSTFWMERNKTIDDTVDPNLVGKVPGRVVAAYDASTFVVQAKDSVGGDTLLLYQYQMPNTYKSTEMSFTGKTPGKRIGERLAMSFGGHIVVATAPDDDSGFGTIRIFEERVPVTPEVYPPVTPIPEAEQTVIGGGSVNNNKWWWCGTPDLPPFFSNLGMA